MPPTREAFDAVRLTLTITCTDRGQHSETDLITVRLSGHGEGARMDPVRLSQPGRQSEESASPFAFAERFGWRDLGGLRWEPKCPRCTRRPRIALTKLREYADGLARLHPGDRMSVDVCSFD